MSNINLLVFVPSLRFFFVTPIGVPMSFQETWSLVTLPISLYAVRCKLVLQCLVWADLWILCSLPLNCQKFVFFYSVARIYLLSPKANATNDSLRPFYCVSWRIIYAIFRLQFKIIFRAAAVAVKAEEGNSSICVICRHIHIIRHIITKIYKYSCRFFFCCFFFSYFVCLCTSFGYNNSRTLFRYSAIFFFFYFSAMLWMLCLCNGCASFSFLSSVSFHLLLLVCAVGNAIILACRVSGAR